MRDSWWLPLLVGLLAGLLTCAMLDWLALIFCIAVGFSVVFFCGVRAGFVTTAVSFLTCLLALFLFFSRHLPDDTLLALVMAATYAAIFASLNVIGACVAWLLLRR